MIETEPLLKLTEGLAGGYDFRVFPDRIERAKHYRRGAKPEVISLTGLTEVSCKIRKFGTSEVTAVIAGQQHTWLFSKRGEAEPLHELLADRLRG